MSDEKKSVPKAERQAVFDAAYATVRAGSGAIVRQVGRRVHVRSGSIEAVFDARDLPALRATVAMIEALETLKGGS